jgi:carbonic anhydrase
MTDELLRRTAKTQAAFFQQYGDFLRESIEKGQSPSSLFISCSDSRLVPEQMLGAKPGEWFVFRSVANLVPPYWQTEIGFAAVLEYAIQVLKVRHVVVLGHTDCGGIQALDTNVDMIRHPALSRWLDLAHPARRLVDAQFSGLEKQERHRTIVELNALEQRNNLKTYPYVQEEISKGQLQLHVWVYYLEDQKLGYFDPELKRFMSPTESG